MNKEWKDKWIQALRSGKYVQGQYGLKTEDNKFCCLGVACDIVDSSKWKNSFELVKDTSLHKQSWEDNNNILPVSVMEAFELNERNPSIALGSNRTRSTSLAQANDEGLTFNEIADIIEREL